MQLICNGTSLNPKRGISDLDSLFVRACHMVKPICKPLVNLMLSF